MQVDEEYSLYLEPAVIVEAVEATLLRHNCEDVIVAVLVTDDDQIQSLNRHYRGIDAATDVLSFPQQSADDPSERLSGLPEELAEELSRHLGDLALAFPYVQRQAARYQSTLLSELRLLIVHGTLHLLGYDHATDEEKATMWAMQGRILASLGENPSLERDDG